MYSTHDKEKYTQTKINITQRKLAEAGKEGQIIRPIRSNQSLPKKKNEIFKM